VIGVLRGFFRHVTRFRSIGLRGKLPELFEIIFREFARLKEGLLNG